MRMRGLEPPRVRRGVAGLVGKWREVAFLHGFGGSDRMAPRTPFRTYWYGSGTRALSLAAIIRSPVRDPTLAELVAETQGRTTPDRALLARAAADLRAARFASLMRAAGRSLEEIGDYVGHTSAYMTDQYRHLLDGARTEVADARDALLTASGVVVGCESWMRSRRSSSNLPPRRVFPRSSRQSRRRSSRLVGGVQILFAGIGSRVQSGR